jgi:hypothetical protein
MNERASALVHAPISVCISLILILLWSSGLGLAANPAPGAGATSRIRQLLADKHHASTPNPAGSGGEKGNGSLQH